MFYLITNPYTVEKEIDMNLYAEFLFPKLNLDGVKMVNPMLAVTPETKHLLCRDHERGYLQHKTLPAGVKPLPYKPYFTFKNMETDKARPQDLISAILVAANGDKSTHVELDIPVALFKLLVDKFSVDVAAGPPATGGTMAVVGIKEVEDIFNSFRPTGAEIAVKMVDTLSTDKKDVLKQYMVPKKSQRFASLNAYMQENKLETLLVSSPLNVQELTGIPLLHNEGGILALYKYNDDKVYILKTDQFEYIKKGRAPLVVHQEFSSLIGSGLVGIEDEDLNLGQFFGLGLGNKETKPVSFDLRLWREQLAGEDLAFYIIAAQATKYGIDTAMKNIYEAVNSGKGINELEAERIHLAAVAEYFDQHKLPYLFRPYFINLHSGARFETPSCAKDYLVTAQSKSIKLDTGIKLYSLTGHLLAVSDIAQTAVFGKEKQAYDILEDIMVNIAIPAAKLGLPGSAVYEAACNAVDSNRQALEAVDMIPTTFTRLSDVYTRDVGHLLGKEEVVSFYFAKSEAKVFTDGMICCFEFQWPHRGFAFGVEDSFVITTEGAINFTR